MMDDKEEDNEDDDDDDDEDIDDDDDNDDEGTYTALKLDQDTSKRADSQSVANTR